MTRPRPWRLLPTPTGTPFTFFHAAVLVVTSVVAEYADPALVHALHQLRWPILLGFGGTLVDDLVVFTDPMTNWGHLLALAIGVATWPVVRRWWKATRDARAGLREGTGPAQSATTAV